MLVELMKDCSFGAKGDSVKVPKSSLSGMSARGEIDMKALRKRLKEEKAKAKPEAKKKKAK